MANLVKTNFRLKQTKLPMNWQQPMGTPGEHLNKYALQDSEKNAIPNPMDLFSAATTISYHVDSCADVGGMFEDYIDGICGAICTGIDNWMKAAMFSIGIISAVQCTITPGSCQGPPLQGMIMAGNPPMSSPMEMKYTNAIASAFDKAWMAWSMGLAGTIMFPPDFAVFTSPVHPPTPNIPLPLAALSSPGEAMLKPSALANVMVGLLADPMAPHHMELFDAIASGFDTLFTPFKASTQITGVKGTGPIPPFAPPYVPCGPVTGGCLVPTPPNLS